MRALGFLGVFFVLGLTAQGARAAEQDFQTWLAAARQEARQMGISEATVNRALPMTLVPIPRIIELDRKQPEKTRTLAQYLEGILGAQRVQDGRTHFRDHRILLSEIGKRYGVEPQYIVALWGIETNYGRITGGYDVVTALATLGWDGRRGPYFRGEMFNALKIIDEGHIAAQDMKGSWAGAMGQTQFMPSSFFKFAVDYNNNGHRNIWKEQEDVFASAANYLAQSGWKRGEPWGHRVKLPPGFDPAQIGPNNSRPLSWWRERGLRLHNGGALPEDTTSPAAVIQPDGAGTPAYIIYDNYRVILRWNRSLYFGTAVGLLADKIKG